MYRFVLVSFVLVVNQTFAQDRFPDPIPVSQNKVQIEDYATIPDSIGLPARLNLLSADPLGRLFVNDQRGLLYTIDSTEGLSAAERPVTEFLDLRDYSEMQVFSSFETGFQSFAFHPEFSSIGSAGYGLFYTMHSSRNVSVAPDFDTSGPGFTPFHSLLLEWKTDIPNANTFTPADSATPYREIMRINQLYNNHNAGLVAFNPTAGQNDDDFGNLYIGVGDGGGGGDPQENGQDASNPYGTLLRINPLGNDSSNGKYGVVAENVFAADEDVNTLAETYAYGLRNPQRFSWDSNDGALYIADIGQGAVEEINLGMNGSNFGWREREGSFPYLGANTTGLTDPIAEYDHTNVVNDLAVGVDFGRAVTTGEVARGTRMPTLEGLLPISDFPTGLIFTLDVDHDPLDGGQEGLLELQPLNDDLVPVRILDLINDARADRGLASASRADVRFSINVPGEIYVLNKQDGIVRRLKPIDGDLNGDAELTVEDVDLLLKAIADQNNSRAFDFTRDEIVDQDDLVYWVEDLKQTWIGDANLDGHFGTADLIAVFQATEFEDGISHNSTWGEGDWNGDLDFTTSDLVLALQRGGFEKGLREPHPVPEPHALVLLLMGVLFARSGIGSQRFQPVTED